MGSFCPLFLFAAMSEITEHIRTLAEPILGSRGLLLWDLEFKKEGPQWLLRLYIDRPGTGATLDDCEAVSRDLGTVLDVEEIIAHAYRLEVSSPGLDRTLSRPEHYQASIGKQVRIKTFQAMDGQKVFVGTLQGLENNVVRFITEQGHRMDIPLGEISKASLVVVI